MTAAALGPRLAIVSRKNKTRLSLSIALFLAFCIDPGAQEPGAIDVRHVAELQCLTHVSGRVWIDVIEETVPPSGNIDELSGDIDSIGILIIYTAFAYQLRLMRKGQSFSLIIVGKDVAPSLVKFPAGSLNAARDISLPFSRANARASSTKATSSSLSS